MNEKEKIMESFLSALQNLGLNPQKNENNIYIEFDYTQYDFAPVRKILDKYIGFWKSIAIKTNHTKPDSMARFTIPNKLITGNDISEAQLFAAIEHIQAKL